MLRCWRSACFVLVLMNSLVLAQGPISMQAQIRGQSFGDRGKCTIEVLVDGVAEVQVSGDSYRIQTLSGRQATARRFVCSSVMPRRMNEFRFTGIDGRGRQTLVRDPRQNGGVAVVRIEDSKPGSEGFTFDLEWSGVSSGNGGPGFGNSGRVFIVNCSSDDGRRRYCPVDTSRGVKLLRQYNSACRGRDNWGFDNRGVWVDRGCRADFQIQR